MQLYRLGIYNAVAVCGTALTHHHLSLLKSLGCTTIYLNFDWDDAGRIATQRVLENVIKRVSGLSVHIVLLPSGLKNIKDPDDLLKSSTSSNDYLELETANCDPCNYKCRTCVTYLDNCYLCSGNRVNPPDCECK